MSEWAYMLAAACFAAGAILITIGVIADICHKRRPLPPPDRHAVVPNTREPL